MTSVTPGGQELYITSLLPTNASITSAAIANDGLTTIADLEPSTYRIVIEDPAHPADARFLHVLQGADAGVAASAVTLIQSSSGTAFDGASVAGSVVMFNHTTNATFAGVTYSEPSTTAHNYVTGLAPNTGYTVTETSSNASTQVSIAIGGSSTSDQSGVLAF